MVICDKSAARLDSQCTKAGLLKSECRSSERVLQVGYAVAMSVNYALYTCVELVWEKSRFGGKGPAVKTNLSNDMFELHTLLDRDTIIHLTVEDDKENN